MKRSCIFWLVLATTFHSGCVERRFVITSDPPGAIVYDASGEPLGATPVDEQFTYYGDRVFTLVRDGFETKVVRQPVDAPWYEIPPIDFVSENLIPYTFRDIRRFDYKLKPAQVVPAEQVLNEAGVERQRGRAIQPPESQQATPLPVVPGQPLNVAPAPVPETGPAPNVAPPPAAPIPSP